jgi:hypothetical protein
MKWVSTLNNETLLIQQYKKTGRVIRQPQIINGFTGIYTREDVELLAAIDTLHDR